MSTDPLASVRAGVAASAVRLGSLLSERGEQMAVAESLTGGLLSSVLAATEDASEWFRGSVTAYQPWTKQRVLGVPRGPVVTEAAARTMAEGVASLLDADLSIAVTGVGGPGPEEGQPAGTVWMAIRYRAHTAAHRLLLEGTPEDICAQTCAAALREATAVVARYERATSG
jgi:nicotinamide-nucleotide amidase